MRMTTYSQAQQLDDTTRARLVGILRRHDVRRASVFGSFARGEQGPESDLDLVIEPSADATLFTLGQLGDALEEAMGRRVDLITFHALETSAHPQLRARILRDLETLFA